MLLIGAKSHGNKSLTCRERLHYVYGKGGVYFMEQDKVYMQGAPG